MLSSALNRARKFKWVAWKNTKIALGYAVRKDIGHGPVALDICERMGMGAAIAHALQMHAWAEDAGIEAITQCTNPLYSSGEDVFAAFFERGNGHAPRKLNLYATEHIFWREAPQTLSVQRSHELLGRYFKPAPCLTEAVDQACRGNRAFDLAIHFRGTDKHRESGFVEHDRMFAALEPYMGQVARAVLATDDPRFAKAVRAAWPAAEFVSYDLGEVPDGTPRHFSSLTPRDKALEALVNIYLIALAPVCVRTSSYLSAISKLINPAMRTVTINRTTTAGQIYPEDEILLVERLQAAAGAQAPPKHPAPA